MGAQAYIYMARDFLFLFFFFFFLLWPRSAEFKNFLFNHEAESPADFSSGSTCIDSHLKGQHVIGMFELYSMFGQDASLWVALHISKQYCLNEQYHFQDHSHGRY
jgi:uncharacterized membrane protein